jgi:putative hemolysin
MNWVKNECKWILIFAIIAALSFIPLGFALKDPSRVYCEELGYTFTTTETLAGDVGVCNFPDGSNAQSWDFLEGKNSQQYSYCKKQGYDMKTISDARKCSYIFSDECAVCILGNGTEVEVAQLMGLDFREGTCGDGKCVIGETYINCPQDCPSGSQDGICDGIKDGICDSDCARLGKQNEDLDCAEPATTTTTTIVPQTTTTLPVVKPSTPIYVYLIAVGVIAVLVIFLISKIRVIK